LKIFGKSILILFLIYCKTTFAQITYIEGVVISSLTSRPIEYANIQDKINLKGVSSDSLGNFNLPIFSKITLLTVTCVGYERSEIRVNPNSFVVIKLNPLDKQLEEITVKPEENPAWKIIRLTLANANRNNPQKLAQFKASHYSKISLNGEIVRFLSKNPKDSLIDKERSLLLVENLGHFYQKNKSQKDVIAHTISSFPKNYPINLMTNSLINPLGFYEPLIQINLNLLTTVFDNSALQNQRFYVNPINEKTFSQYNFSLIDTLDNGSDSTFSILFEPKNSVSINGLKGLLRINSDGYAIEEVHASNADSLQTMQFVIKQNYQKTKGIWHPKFRLLGLDYLLKIDKKDLKLTYQIEDYFSDFTTDFSQKEVTFDGTNRLVMPKADTISKSEFDKMRAVQLLPKEELLYKKAEMANKKLFTQKVIVPVMALFNTAINNGLMAGPFFLLYNQLDYNQHKGLRLGLGIQNDIQRTPRWRVYVGSAYGLEDQKLKYEGILSYHITKDRYNKIEIYGGNDLRRPGQNPLLFANYVLPQRLGLNLGSDNYLLDNYKKIGFAAFFKPFNWTQVKVFYEREIRTPVSYKLTENAVTDYQHIGLSFRFARKETMTRTGYFEKVLNPYFPIIRLNISRFASQKAYYENFWKANLVISHQIRTKKIGKTMTVLSAGNSWGILPFQYLFNNLSVPLNIWGSNSKEGFQMLNTAELGYNNYVSFSAFHDFEKSIWRLNSTWFQPEFMIGNKMAIGKLTQTAPIINEEPLKDIKSGIFEASLSIRNIVKIKVFGFKIGLGANLVYDYSSVSFGTKRFGIRPFILPVFF
jgi:hypothetical protein